MVLGVKKYFPINLQGYTLQKKTTDAQNFMLFNIYA